MKKSIILKEKNHEENLESNQGWLYILLAFVLMLITAVLGLLFYNQQSQIIHQNESDKLRSIAELKSNQIQKWQEERLNDALIFSKNPMIAHAINQWMLDPANEELESEIDEAAQDTIYSADYKNILISTNEGVLLFSANKNKTSLDEHTLYLVQKAYQSKSAVMGDLYKSVDDGEGYLDFAAPIYNPDQSSQAIIILQTDPDDFLFPMIQTWPVPSQSAETLLIRQENDKVLFLNSLRHSDAPPLSLTIPLTQKEVPAVQALSGVTGEVTGPDYRGKEVFAQILPVNGTPWYLIAKIDHDEMMASTQTLVVEIILISVLSMIMIGLITVFVYYRHQRNLLLRLYQSEQLRSKAQEEIHTTLYSIGDGVITTDEKGNVTRLNPVAESLTGWSEAEAIGKPLNQIFQIVNEHTREKVENPVNQVLKQGIIIGLANHTLLIAKDGTERPIADSGAPIRDKKGQISGVVLVFRDQSTEYASQKERALLDYTIKTSLNEIFLFDAKTYKFRFVNEGALRNLGYSLDEMQNMTPLDIKPAITRSEFEQIVQPLIDHEKLNVVFETIHRRADGSEYPAEVHLQLFEYAGDQVFLAVVNDISERKASENKLHQNEARLLQAQAVAHVGNWELNLGDQTMWASQEAFRIYGLDYSSPYIPLNVAQSIPLKEDRSRLDAALKSLIEENCHYDVEYGIRRQNDKSLRVIHSIAHVIRNDQGNPIKVIGILQDVTDLKKTEQSLVESEKRYRSLFENNHAMVLIINPEDGSIIDANPAACTFYGWALSEITSLQISQINTLSPDEIQAEMQLAQEEKRKYFFFKHRKKSGEICDVEVISGPIQLNGQTFLYSIIQDVTERKQIEKAISIQHDIAIRLSTETSIQSALCTLLDSILSLESLDCGGIYTIDPVSGALQLVEHRGLSEEFIIRNSYFPPDSNNARIAGAGQIIIGNYSEISQGNKGQYIQEGLQAVAIIPVLYQNKLVALLNLSSHTHREIPLPIQTVLMSLAQQIGNTLARIQSADALRESEIRTREIIENSEAGYFFIDRDGIFQKVNSAWLRLHQYPSAEEIIGKHFSITQVEADLDQAYKIVNKLLSGQEISSAEFSHRCQDGSTGYHTFSARPVKEAGEIIGLEGFLIDTTDRIRTREALEKRLVALTLPLDDESEIEFEDLFNLQDIQRLQDDFANAAGVASIIIYPNGTPITSPSNFCVLCKDIIRKSEQGIKNCFKSDATIGRFNPNGPVVQPCMSGGLWDAGAAISVGGKHIASWLVGQVRDETQSEEKIREYARLIGADEEATVIAFNEVPSMSKEQFQRISKALFTIANELSKIAYQNVQQARFISEKKIAEDSLRASEIRFRSTIQQSFDGMVITDENFKIIEWNQAMTKIFGFTPDEMIGNYLWTFHYAILPQEQRTSTTLEEIKNDLLIRKSSHFTSSKDSLLTLQIQTKDGEEKSIQFSTFEIQSSSERLYCSISRDLTEYRKSEERYQMLFSEMFDGFALHEIILDETGKPVDYRFLAVNPAFERLTGLNARNVIGKTVLEILPDTEPYWIDVYGQVAITGMPTIFENFSRETGKFYEVTAFRSARGQFACIFEDVTKRKQSDADIKSAYARLEALWSITSLEELEPQAISNHVLATITKMTDSKYGFYGSLNEDESILTINSFSADVHQHCAMPEESITFSVQDGGLWAEAIRLRKPFILNNYEEDASPGKKGLPLGHVQIENLLVVPHFSHGKITSLAAVANRLGGYVYEDINQINALLTSVEAIIESKRIEEVLRVSEERYHLIDDASQDMIYSYDLNSRFTHANSTLCRFLNLSPEQIIGRTHIELGFLRESCDEWDQLHQEVLKTNASVYAESSLLTSNGDRQYFDVTLNPMHNEIGEIIGIAGVTRDITVRKRSQEQIQAQLEELRRWNAVTLGREDRILELKREVNQILSDIGQPPRYPTAWD